MFPRSGSREGLGLFASAGRQPPRLRSRSRTTPRARGRARAYHHRGRSCGGEREATRRLAFTSGRVTRDNGSRHGRYSAAGVSIGTERASITTTTTTTTTVRGHGTGHLGRACAMHARPSRRCEFATISRTARTPRTADADRRSLAPRPSPEIAAALTLSLLKSAGRHQRSGRTPTPYTCIQAWYSAIGGNPSGTRHGGPSTPAAIGPPDT